MVSMPTNGVAVGRTGRTPLFAVVRSTGAGGACALTRVVRRARLPKKLVECILRKVLGFFRYYTDESLMRLG